MNDTPAAQSPAQQLVEVIDAHKYSPLVLATPLAKLLPLLRQYILTSEARIAALEGQK